MCQTKLDAWRWGFWSQFDPNPQKRPIGWCRRPILFLVFEAPRPFGDTSYVFLEEKNFLGKKKFWPILAQKDWEKFRVRAQKGCFWSAQGFCGPNWGLLGPFLTLLGPSVGSNVCIKCFL